MHFRSCASLIVLITSTSLFPLLAYGQENADWKPGDPKTVLPGLIPRPAEIPEIGRWQAMTTPISAYVKTIKFSPDGRRFAFGDGYYVRIHNANSLRLQGVLVGHTANVRSIDWSPNGKLIATAAEDKSVRFWKANGAPGPICRGHTDAVTCVSWSPDGKQVASGSLDGTIRIWSVEGKPSLEINGHQAAVHALDWHPDGTRLAAGDENQTIRLWNADGSAAAEMTGHVGQITTVQFSADGKWLASGSTGIDPQDPTKTVPPKVRLWSADGKPGPVLEGHAEQINAVAWHPKSNNLVSVAQDRSALIWQSDGTLLDKFDGNGTYTGVIFSVDWHPKRPFFIVGGRFVVRYLSAEGEVGPTKLIRPQGSKLQFVDWNPRFEKIAVAGSDGQIHIWSADFKSKQTIKAFPQGVNCLRFDPSGERLAAMASRAVQIWNAEGETILQFAVEGNSSRDLAWSPSGEVLATATRHDGKVTLFDIQSGTPRFTFTDHDGLIHSLSFSPDGERIATSGGDGSVRLHRLLEGMTAQKTEVIRPVDDGDVDAVEISPDGKWIASGHTTSIRLWKPEGEPGPVIPGVTASVLRIDWSPDSAAFATASWDTSVKIWDTKGNLLKNLPPHAAPCWGVSFSPDGKQLVSCGWDGIVRVVDVETGEVQSLVIYVSDSKITKENNYIRPQSPISFSQAGQLLNGDPENLESRIVYLVEQPSGAIKVMRPSQFFSKLPAGYRQSASDTP